MNKFAILLIVMTGLFIFACSDSTDDATSGKLSVSITDSPFPVDWLDSAIVNINKIEVRNAEQDSSENGFTDLSEKSFRINLLDLRNGVTDELVNLDIPAGSYDLVRLYVDWAKVKFTTGDTYEMKIPSGSQTGIKVFISPAVEVSGGLTSELLLDFDISKSFVLNGNPKTPADVKGIKFKPVVRAVNNSTAGRIVGSVADTAAVTIADAQVWISNADSILTATYTDDAGAYQLIGVPAGSYSVSASIAGYDTVSVENATVVAGNMTDQDFVLTPQN